jgi:DNA-binding transcriptional MerR regulator
MPQAKMNRTYRTREFSELASVTVRTLHHYDRLGLLTPPRTQTGYRVYGEKDLETLEQIVALKFIGLPLDKIKSLLRRKPVDLSAALRAQRTLLEQRKSLLERVIRAIGQAERTLHVGCEADSAVFRHIIEVIDMQHNSEEWKKQYEALVQTNFERLPSLSLDAKTQLREQFADLFKEVERAVGEDPASPHAQQLADRCVELLRTLTVTGQLNPKLLKIAAAYLSEGEWLADATPPEPPFGGKSVWEFMSKAIAIRY